MTNLWSANSPAEFWQVQRDISEAQWWAAIEKALPILELPIKTETVDDLLEAVLGEKQFGENRWTFSPSRRLYYEVKPFLPRIVIDILRRLISRRTAYLLNWHIEERYMKFLWTAMRYVMDDMGVAELPFKQFWRDNKPFAFVLTHDIETQEGQAYARAVADLDEAHGFRSVFNFVSRRYPLDHALIDELRARGFEIGFQGLFHDGKKFLSKRHFMHRIERMNADIAMLGAVNFCAPLTHRQPEWMQMFDIEYSLSFFDTDPFEPMPGGVMTIFPFFIGKFVEMPYTLPQDYLMLMLRREKSPRLWLEKVDFIRQYHGMALLTTHPDYLLHDHARTVYVDFLKAMQARDDYWHALPRDVARWWRERSTGDTPTGKIALTGEGIALT